MSVCIAARARERGKLPLREALDDPLRDDGDAAVVIHALLLHDGTGDRVDDGIEIERIPGKVFRNDRKVRAGGLAHAEREGTRFAPHAHDEVPARRRSRIDDQALDDAGSHRTRRFKSERRRIIRQGKIVVDRLGDRHDAETPFAQRCDAPSPIRGIVAADRDEIAHA